MSESYKITSNPPSDETVVRLTAQGFQRAVTEQFAFDALQVVRRCEGFQTATDDADGTVGYVGYTRYPFEQGKTLYLNTVMVDAARQGSGVSGLLLRSMVQHELDARYVGFKTQSARMYSAANRIFGNIYPPLDPAPIPDEIAHIGNSLAAARGGDFPIHRGLYGGKPLYGTRQDTIRLPGFYDMIDFEAGDALLCVCKLVREE